LPETTYYTNSLQFINSKLGCIFFVFLVSSKQIVNELKGYYKNENTKQASKMSDKNITILLKKIASKYN